MSAWIDLRRGLGAGLTIYAERERGFSASMRNGQRVAVDVVAGFIGDWLVVRAEVCAASEIDPERALERNGQLAIGALVLADGDYWLRVALPLASPELDDAPRLLASCAGAARAMSPAHCFPRADDEPAAIFSHYCD